MPGSIDDEERCWEGEVCEFEDLVVEGHLSDGDRLPPDYDDDWSLPDDYTPYDGEPPDPSDQPDPFFQPQRVDPRLGQRRPVTSEELVSLAERTRGAALTALDSASGVLTWYLDGGGTAEERAYIERAINRSFPGARRRTIGVIRDVLVTARGFLATARFVGVANDADALALGTTPEDVLGFNYYFYRPQPNAATHGPSHTIFLYPGFATYSRIDRASILTHEPVHSVPEPGAPAGDAAPDIDHGYRGPLDNAFNFQFLTAELAELPISARLLGEIVSQMSR